MKGSDLRAMSKKEQSSVTSLGRLLARMALDDALHRRFLEDEDAVIDEAGLSPEEADALRDGDWDRIKVLLGPGKRTLPKDRPLGGGN